MKNRVKKLTSLVIAVAMVFSFIPGSVSPVYAADDTTVITNSGNNDNTEEKTSEKHENLEYEEKSSEIDISGSEKDTVIQQANEDVTEVSTEEVTEATSEEKKEEVTETKTEENTEEKTSEKTTEEKIEKSVNTFEKMYNVADLSNDEINAIDFSSCELLIATEDESIFTADTNVVSGYDGVYLTKYDNAEMTKNAFTYYYDKADFVEANIEFKVSDNETDETSDTADLSDINNGDDAISVLNDIVDEGKSAKGTIAVIDTGINADELVDKVSLLGDDVSDDNGHGTKMYNYIREEDADAKILSIKAMDKNGKGQVSDVYAAIQYAIEKKADIILLSISAYSTQDSEIIKNAIDDATDKGIVVVGAAGNYGKKVKYYIPGNIENAVIAGSIDKDGYKKDFSNYGDTVDYYVVSESTSEAAARLSGIISKNGKSFNNVSVVLPENVNFGKPEEKKDEELDDKEDEKNPEDRTGTFDVQAYDGSGDGQAYLTYIGDKYVTWGDDTYRSSFGVATRKFFICNGSDYAGEAWNAYCVDPILTKPDKGVYKIYEVGIYIGKVMYYMYGAPGWDTPLSCLGGISLHQYVNNQGYTSEDGYVTVCHYLLATLAETQKLGGTGYSDSPNWVQGLATVLVNGAPNPPKGFHCYFAFSYEKNHEWQNVWGWKMSPPPYMVTLEKSSTVASDNRSLDGIKYGLYNAENKLIATYTLGANGKTKAIDIYKGVGSIAGDDDAVVTEDGAIWLEWWSSLSSQKWYFKELNTNSNYAVKSSGILEGGNWNSEVPKYNITVKQGENTTAKASDTPVYGMIEVFKYADKDKTKPLSGAEFTVYSDADCTKSVGKMGYNDGSGRHEYTNAKGYATLTGLTPGTYYVKETKAPNGYTASKQTYTVHVKVSTGQVSWGNAYMGYVFDPVYYFNNSLTTAERNTLGIKSTSADNLSAEDIDIMFRHYIKYGLSREVTSRIGTPYFRADQYLANRPDLATAWVSSTDKANYNNSINVFAAYHYAQHGAREGAMGRSPEYYASLNEGVNHDNQISVAVLVSNEQNHAYVALKKESSNPSCSNNNPNYSLKGAEYKIFISNADATNAKSSKDYSKAIGTFTVKEDGTSNVIEVTDYMNVNPTTGAFRNTNFYVIETKTGKNYAMDNYPHPVQVTADNNTIEKAKVLSVEDTPIDDPINITVVKQFADGHTEPLQGAEFTIKYYPEDTSQNYTFSQLQSKSATETQTLTSDNKGKIIINNAGNYWPIGYLTIEETKAPTGFKLEDSEVTVNGKTAPTKMAFAFVSSGNTTTGYSGAGAVLVKDDSTRDASVALNINVTNQITYNDEEIRADFTIYKENGTTGQRIAGVKYEIINVDTNEKYEFVTDSNGYFSSQSSYKSHSAEGGMWFKKGVQNTTQDKPDDTMGALPYGTYKVTEIDSKGLQKEEPYTFNVRDNGTVYRVFDRSKTSTSQVNSNMPLPTLKTYAAVVVNENGQTVESKIVPASAGQTINDVCTYTNLRCNTDYTLMGTLMKVDKNGNATVFKDGNGNDAVAIKPFKTKAAYEKSLYEASGKETVVFSNLDFTDIQDTSFVVYERLYVGKLTLDDIKNNNFDTSYVGANNDTVKFPLVHEDLKDKDQTVSTPTIGTEATSNDTTKTVTSVGEITIVDTVEFKGLEIGKEYLLSGKLYRQPADLTKQYTEAEIEAMAVKDKNGNFITASQSFTPTASDGTTTVTFKFDASDVTTEAVSYVVFETLYDKSGKIKFATHTDISDDSQSVHQPKIGTTAKGTEGRKELLYTQGKFIDTVSYTNLEPETLYKLVGIAMDKKTGKKLVLNGKEVKANKEFTSVKANRDNGTAEGSWDLEFKLIEDQYEDLRGKDIVIFEALYNQEGTLVATHNDINDIGQELVVPDIHTTLTDKKTEDHIAYPDEETTLIDKVSYTNLLEGKSYVMNGTLMVKNTNKPLLDKDGKEIKASKPFTAAKGGTGTVDVEFKFDASVLNIKGETLVAFEECIPSDGKIPVGVHMDISDIEQSVKIPDGHTTATDAKTDDHITFAEENAVINDVITYTNLIADGKHEYVAKGVLMDKATGKPVLDKDGKEITNTVNFTPSESDGTVTVPFEFDASVLKGQKIVVFEDVYYNNKEVIIHHDINDVDQTTTIPKGHTDADDAQTQIGMGNAAPEALIYDYVFYDGLLVGKEYTCVGTLMNKATNKPFLDQDGKEITSTVKFTAEEESGHIVVPFKFDASLLKGQKVVVFEDVYYNEKEVIIHHDITDEKQTVVYPEVTTTATLKNNKTYKAGETVTVFDEVKCDNVIAGETYRVKGCLMDKATGKLFTVNGKVFTSEKEFVAKNTSETITVEYTFDSKNVGNFDVVVFEELYVVRDINGKKTEVLVGYEKDIANKNQTVSVYTVPQTGDSIPVLPVAGTGAVALIGMATIVNKKRKKRED